MRLIATLSLPLLAAACVTAPDPVPPHPPIAPRECVAADLDGLEGRRIDSVTLPSDLTVRVVEDGMMVTADFQPDRMTIYLDKGRRIVQASCT